VTAGSYVNSARIQRQSSGARILLLALLLFRAYIPAGFMPAAGAPFLLELCPSVVAGMPAHHQHHHPSGSHADFEACPFGSAPGAGPISHHLEFALAAPATSGPLVVFATARITVRAQHDHQARGPPSHA
jgi:hypothetical protein